MNAAEYRDLYRQFGVICRRAPKTATQTNNTANLVADSELVLKDLRPYSWYAVMGMILMDSTSTGDIKFDWTGPTGGTPHLILMGGRTNIGIGTTDQKLCSWSAFSSSVSLPLTNFEAVGSVHGTIQIGATGGDVTLRWAQDTLDAGPTQVLVGSWLIAFPLT